MQEKTDILVVGGGPAGIVSAITARKHYPNRNVVLMKSIGNGCIPCGIPYMLSSLKDPSENKLGNVPLEKNHVKIVVDKAISIDRKTKKVTTKNNDAYRYEKLILAVGSSPIAPPIKGIDKDGVHPIYKDMDYLTDFVEKTKRSKAVLIIGGGFIGVEFADEISKIKGIKVYLVEMLPNLLANSFDEDFSALVEQKLKSKGVEVLKNIKVNKILGENKVEAALLSDGSKIIIDNVILGMGAMPNTKLASDARLDLDQAKGIQTDEYMRTMDPDIFAIGDCAGKRDFFTRKYAPVMLASTAASEARIAGANLYGLKVVRDNKGTIAVYSTYIDGLMLGSAGLTEYSARKEGFEIVIGKAQGIDKHPGTLPGADKMGVKLIFSSKEGILLGGQVFGGMACAELINFIGIAVQKRMTCAELETLQIATHPYLTSSPIMYPIIVAAQDASTKT